MSEDESVDGDGQEAKTRQTRQGQICSIHPKRKVRLSIVENVPLSGQGIHLGCDVLG
jgi:hypothetical protein